MARVRCILLASRRLNSQIQPPSQRQRNSEGRTMLTIMQAGRAWIDLQDRPQEVSYGTQAFHRERKWRQFERNVGVAIEDIAISRWRDLQNTSRHEEATTPPDRYFIGIAL